MSLKPRQIRWYTDTFSCYRKVGTGYVQTVTNQPCRLFTTPNYDVSAEGYGLRKQTNIFTSNHLHFDSSLDVRGEDVLQVISPTTLIQWFSVKGDVQTRGTVANRSAAFIDPDVRPLGIA